MDKLLPGPIFVVGQPRSGSTILTRVLNDAPGLFVINDFYVLQHIDADNLWGPLRPSDCQKIAAYVYGAIEVRATQTIGKTLSQPIHLTLDELADLKTLTIRDWPVGTYWHEILNEVMSRAAILAGCDRWGYNTPQDHLHLGRLFEGFPDCRVVLQLRQPKAVLSSYKNVVEHPHDQRRYNPLAIGAAWRAAAISYEKWASVKPDSILFLPFEDLVQDTTGAIQKLSTFLDCPFPQISLSSYESNTSYVAGTSKKAITDTELLICHWVIGDVLERLGFAHSGKLKIGWGGIWETLKSMWMSMDLFVEQYLLNRNARLRIMRLLLRRS